MQHHIPQKMKSSKVIQLTTDATNTVAMKLQPPYNIHIHVLRSSSEIRYSLNFKSWFPVPAPSGFKENVQAYSKFHPIIFSGSTWQLIPYPQQTSIGLNLFSIL
jgi:hypothetical protein